MHKVTDLRHHAQAKKRNRKERQSALVYRVEHLYPEGNPVEGLEECYIEGDLGDYKVVSVPVTTSRRMQEEIKQTLQTRLNVPILVISHNTSFMRAVRLSPKEAAKVIKHGEDYAEAYTDSLAAYQAAKEGVGVGAETDSDGSGPGVGFDRISDTGKGTREESELFEAEGDPDQEGGQERPSKPEGNS